MTTENRSPIYDQLAVEQLVDPLGTGGLDTRGLERMSEHIAAAFHTAHESDVTDIKRGSDVTDE